MWSLVAQFAHSKDAREKSWHHLWTKQVKYLDSEGGIALKTLGFKVTSVRMVQVSF